MKKIKYIFLIVFVVVLEIQCIYILSTTLTLSTMKKIIFIAVQTISIIGFTYFYTLDKDQEIKNRWIYFSHIIIFLIYFIYLGYVLLFDLDYGRNAQSLVGYELINLKPMKTIQLFINGYHLGVLGLESILMNIGGNLVIFMPMSYFLPFFFVKQRKWYIFFITIAFIVLGVEILQVLLQTGTGDIDDWFLNVAGAMFLYGFLRKFFAK